MGFWSDTKKIIGATGSALNDGLALLAEGASELERISHRQLLETKNSVLERDRTRLGSLWFAAGNARKDQELMKLY